MDNYGISHVLYGILGVIINYIVISFGIPYAFPNVYSLNFIKNRLDVTNVRVPLTIGSCNFSSASTEINTSNPYKNNFIFMPHSNNNKGGSQFTYTFWLDIKSNYEKYLTDKVIFMRGLKNKSKGLLTDTSNELPLVSCPLVKFGSAPSSQSENRSDLLEIIFNTINNPHTKVTLNEDVYKFITSTNSNRKWFLISIVFQDYMDFSNNEKGIQIQNYINDNLVSTKIIKNDSLKLNNCNTHIYPYPPEDSSGDIESDSSFADITYYNYALDILDIEKIYFNGLTTTADGCRTAKSDLNARDDYYNKLSMNNYL